MPPSTSSEPGNVNSPVLVTGASGFAGSHLLEHLAASHDVVGWARSTPPPEVASLARWQRIDLLDRDAVNAAIRELEPASIFHCAGFPQVAESWGDTTAPLAVNVLGTHRLIDAVRLAATPCRLLVTGSAHVYAPSTKPITETHPVGPASPYALSKLAQEQLVLRAAAEDGIDVVVTRSFNHTGARQKPSFVAPSIARQIALIERGQLEPVIRVGNLDAERDLLDVRDAARAYVALMEAGVSKTVYNVASGVSRPVRAILDALLSRARVPIRVETDPAKMRANDIPVLVGDARRLRAATGWEPRISFDQMIDDLLAYWRREAKGAEGGNG
jgi:GDP-4-dehydro-6-deoxy-D-mannose reductase